MNLERYISGDWGTSRLRLSLCLGGDVLDARQGPGIGALREPPEQVLHRLSAGWRERHGAVPVVLRGMAGSRNGWRETPYVPCPADPGALHEAALRFEALGAPATLPGGRACCTRSSPSAPVSSSRGAPPSGRCPNLSGLMIGADAHGAIPLLDTPEQIILIGDAALNGRYALALRREGLAASALDGERCALTGLRTLWQP